MDNTIRIEYNIGDVTINGIQVHGLNKDKTNLSIKAWFNLEQTFCSCCPCFPTKEMEKEFGKQIEVLNSECSHAKGKKMLRPLTKAEAKNIF